MFSAAIIPQIVFFFFLFVRVMLGTGFVYEKLSYFLERRMLASAKRVFLQSFVLGVGSQDQKLCLNHFYCRC